jgi:UDP-N-acetylglucosamine acyltransferase
MKNIHPTAEIAPEAEIGDGVEIDAFVSIGPDVTVGDNCSIGEGAVIKGVTTLGSDNILYPHAVLGTGPQDLKYHGEPTRLEVGNENVFREFVTINTGTPTGTGVTRIGDRNLFMINSHVGHDCVVEDETVLVNGVLVGGHSRIEMGAKLMGAAAVNPFVTVGRQAYVGGLTRIVQDAPPFMIVEGNPAKVRGVNEIGLQRAGYSQESIDKLWETYKSVYRTKELNRSRIFEELESDPDQSEEVLYLVRFLRRAVRGKHGRFRESLRED